MAEQQRISAPPFLRPLTTAFLPPPAHNQAPLRPPYPSATISGQYAPLWLRASHFLAAADDGRRRRRQPARLAMLARAAKYPPSQPASGSGELASGGGGGGGGSGGGGSGADAVVIAALEGKRVAVTGGTGLIGRTLVRQLIFAGANVTLLSRDVPRARALFAARASSSSDPPAVRGEGDVTVVQYDAAEEGALSTRVCDAVRDADAVVNLAGEPIEEGRWTPDRKRILLASRVVGTRKLANAIAASPEPAVFVSASAVGFYGTSESAVFTEDAPNGADFLAQTAALWEKAALSAVSGNAAGRVVVLRIGVVLARGGGALAKMAPAFRAFMGGPPGGGRQWFSWVHVDDVVRLMLHACADSRWDGVYNATAPHPVRLAVFCRELGRAMGRPSWLPVPGRAVRLLMGSEAAQLVLAGQQVESKRSRDNGFVYRYKNVEAALRQLVVSDKEALSRTP